MRENEQNQQINNEEKNDMKKLENEQGNDGHRQGNDELNYIQTSDYNNSYEMNEYSRNNPTETENIDESSIQLENLSGANENYASQQQNAYPPDGYNQQNIANGNFTTPNDGNYSPSNMNQYGPPPTQQQMYPPSTIPMNPNFYPPSNGANSPEYGMTGMYPSSNDNGSGMYPMDQTGSFQQSPYPPPDWSSGIVGDPIYMDPNVMYQQYGTESYTPYKISDSSGSDSDIDKPGNGEKAEAVKRSFCYKLFMWQLSSKIALFCFLFSLLALSGVIVGVVYSQIYYLFIIPGVFLAINYCYYVIQVLLCSTWKYLSNFKSKSDINQYLGDLKKITPVIKMTAECYHYETRTTTRVQTTGDGRTVTSVESRQEKVVTARPVEIFTFSSFTDTTQNFGFVEGSTDSSLVKLNLCKTWECADEYTQMCWESFVKQFKEKNHNRDTHVSYLPVLDIGSFENRFLASPNDQKSFFWSPTVYLLASLFFLQLPYRIAFDLKCKEQKCDITKRIKVDEKS
mmetsp:Transcript_2975/g.4354  ORF Transcript_2975/g.4354 Transcript_2975/m.4354 type:complete len:512 (-) Transcript_2975:14-1549(-)